MNNEAFREPTAEVDAIARAVVDAAVEVHRLLGPGYAETVYEAALCHELGLRGLAYERQALVRVRYKDIPVGEGRLDLVVENLVIVELKAVPTLAPVHIAQVISYLKATRRSLGLLLNFGGQYMKSGIRRVVLMPAAEVPASMRWSREEQESPCSSEGNP